MIEKRTAPLSLTLSALLSTMSRQWLHILIYGHSPHSGSRFDRQLHARRSCGQSPFAFFFLSLHQVRSRRAALKDDNATDATTTTICRA
jgi:hypothetical protein